MEVLVSATLSSSMSLVWASVSSLCSRGRDTHFQSCVEDRINAYKVPGTVNASSQTVPHAPRNG